MPSRLVRQRRNCRRNRRPWKSPSPQTSLTQKMPRTSNIEICLGLRWRIGAKWVLLFPAVVLAIKVGRDYPSREEAASKVQGEICKDTHCLVAAVLLQGRPQDASGRRQALRRHRDGRREAVKDSESFRVPANTVCKATATRQEAGASVEGVTRR